jgi:hypothetical protein
MKEWWKGDDETSHLIQYPKMMKMMIMAGKGGEAPMDVGEKVTSRQKKKGIITSFE